MIHITDGALILQVVLATKRTTNGPPSARPTEDGARAATLAKQSARLAIWNGAEEDVSAGALLYLLRSCHPGSHGSPGPLQAPTAPWPSHTLLAATNNKSGGQLGLTYSSHQHQASPSLADRLANDELENDQKEEELPPWAAFAGPLAQMCCPRPQSAAITVTGKSREDAAAETERKIRDAQQKREGAARDVKRLQRERENLKNELEQLKLESMQWRAKVRAGRFPVARARFKCAANANVGWALSSSGGSPHSAPQCKAVEDLRASRESRMSGDLRSRQSGAPGKGTSQSVGRDGGIRATNVAKATTPSFQVRTAHAAGAAIEGAPIHWVIRGALGSLSLRSPSFRFASGLAFQRSRIDSACHPSVRWR